MVSAVDRTLADAALSAPERRVLRRLVTAIEGELGASLKAVWLYGSRARGEADPSEVDPDRRSDIDLMVIVDPSTDAAQAGRRMVDLAYEVVGEEGDSPVYYSILAWDLDRLRERREIRGFFIQEVDRDKLVLVGSPLTATELA